jgi:hypothetical protein
MLDYFFRQRRRLARGLVHANQRCLPHRAACAVAAFGRTSFTVAQVVFHGTDCAATGRATMVFLDLATRRPEPLPQEQIARLSPYKYLGD